MSELTFDFEDKLKKFIEENCGYNFNIEIKKDVSGVHISNAIDTDGIFKELENLDYCLNDMNNYEREHEQIELEDEIYDSCKTIRLILKGE